MSTITTKDGTEIYYKDWGEGPVVTFSHGWPLNADAWDGQMLFLSIVISGRPASADDAQREPGRAAALHQPVDLMPVDAIGVDLSQAPGDAQPRELRHAPVVHEQLVAAGGV
jgi:non-heme chloroperoxidase